MHFSKKHILIIAILSIIALSLFQENKFLETYSHGAIHVLDIGQGDSILIITPNRQKILIDGGDTNVVMEQLPKHLSFFDKSIDILILTHPHADHVMGLVEVLKRYQVKNIFWTGVNYRSNAYTEFLKIAREKNIPMHIISGEKDYALGHDLYLDILAPVESIAGVTRKNLNDSSIVFRLFLDGKPIAMLTGDAEVGEEQEMLAAGLELQADLLKVGHHGSKTSTSQAFLRAVAPKEAVISVGEGNRFGHPHEEALQRLNGVEVRMTKDEGTISSSFLILDH